MFPIPTSNRRRRKGSTSQAIHIGLNSRRQLIKEGRIKLRDLDGPDPPHWFILQCDGCSVPTKAAKMFLRAEKFAWPCQKHDFMYYLAALQWTPGSPQWQGYRFEADATLRDNIKLVAKNRFFGFLYSRIYFRGVRIGGRAAMKTQEELAVPPTAKARAHLKKFLDKPITAMAQRQLKKWEQTQR